MTPRELDITNELVEEGWEYLGESSGQELMFVRVFFGENWVIHLRADR